jgi:hypothetical protein
MIVALEFVDENESVFVVAEIDNVDADSFADSTHGTSKNQKLRVLVCNWDKSAASFC